MAEAEQEETPERPVPPFDGYLEMWVRLANQVEGDGVASVTLMMGGAVVSGDLISPDAYFEEQAKMIKGAGPESENAIRNWSKPEDEALRKRLLDEPRFIHMKNAQILTGSQFVPSEGGVYWRGRIDRVDGWIMGKLNKK